MREPPHEGTESSPMTPQLVYDGDCGLCTASVRFVERHVMTTAELVPYQITDLARLGTTAARAEHEVLWVDRSGRVFGGAQAVAELLIDAGGAWRPAGALMRLPPVSWVASAMYRLIARNRHRLPGGTSACVASSPWRPR